MALKRSVSKLTHFLIISLALNVGLLLKMYREGQKGSLFNGYSLAPKVSLLLPSSGSRHLSSSNPSSPAEGGQPEDEKGDRSRVISLAQGDPTVYEKYWAKLGDKATIVVPGWQSLSYFSDVSNLCWFLEPELAKQVVRLHGAVGNAATSDRYLIVGTGATQLYQALLYALVPQNVVRPVNVVSAVPFYNHYPAVTDCLRSGLYKWAGDATSFNEDGQFIEIVTSPNNPDGTNREPVVSRSGGTVIYDLAYYWPQYTPITSPANQDIMLFTVSKSTGHAGTRIGWALVKDKAVAEKMVEFIMLSTIGVSKDSQLRAAKLLQVAADSCESPGDFAESLFDYGSDQMSKRWKLLREAVKQSGLFSVPTFPPEFCNFSNRTFEPRPAFAWLKCEEPIEDCEKFLRDNKILTRSGKHFGAGPEYTRVSMLDRDENMEILFKRLARAKTPLDERIR